MCCSRTTHRRRHTRELFSTSLYTLRSRSAHRRRHTRKLFLPACTPSSQALTSSHLPLPLQNSTNTQQCNETFTPITFQMKRHTSKPSLQALVFSSRPLPLQTPPTRSSATSTNPFQPFTTHILWYTHALCRPGRLPLPLLLFKQHQRTARQ
jgi:hypothetical protein